MEYEAQTVPGNSPVEESIRLRQEPESWPPSRQQISSPQFRSYVPQGHRFAVHRCIERILVPTDFSSRSARALEFAVALARQCDATLTVLHVIDLNAQYGRECFSATDLMKRTWENGADRMGELAFSLNGQVNAQTMLEEGLPWEQIVEKSRTFDLIVLGKDDFHSGWKLFSKRTAEQVLENTECPVLVVG